MNPRHLLPLLTALLLASSATAESFSGSIVFGTSSDLQGNLWFTALDPGETSSSVGVFAGYSQAVSADYTYLYDDGNSFVFMDPENFEQTEVARDVVGDWAAYLQENMAVSLSVHEDKAIAIELPAKVTLAIVETEPVVRGQTAANSFKPAVLENGVRTTVPPFIAVGEKIVVNTADGSYVRRAE